MRFLDKLKGKVSTKVSEEVDNNAFVQYEYIMTLGNQVNIALLKSILDAERVTYYIKGEFNPKAPKELHVDKEQKQDVLDVLTAYNIDMN